MDYTRVDESVRQGLIQDKCELSQFITCSQLGSLSLYLQALEQLIEGGKKEHIDKLRLRVCESIACRVEFVHRFDKISESLAFEKYRIEPT